MPSDAPIIAARGVSKMYELYARPQDRLRQMLFPGGKPLFREHWALRDVSFEVGPGEAFGIIGKNGAGKSTLLQILAGVLEPTSGEVVLPERTTALLELGSGFKPEFTGRQNVFVNAAVLGIPRATVTECLDEIAAFADIGAHFDQPVKTYSSGMFLRLAFAVTTSLNPDVLIIDEALAVGDVFFRQKCYKRLEGLLSRGTVVVLVSHAMNDVAQFCHRGLMLERGRVTYLGDAAAAVKRYMVGDGGYDPANLGEVMRSLELPPEAQANDPWPASEAFVDLSQVAAAENDWAGCTHVAICDASGQPCRSFEQGETLSIFCRYAVYHDLEVAVAGVELINDKRVIVFGKNTLQFDSDHPTLTPAGSSLRVRFDVKLDLAPGEYTFNLGFSAISREDFDRRASLSHQELESRTTVISILTRAGDFLVTFRSRDTTPVQLTHHGVANLPGQATLRLYGSGGEGEESLRRPGGIIPPGPP
ncbi:ABC transporter ATP-binding protein [Desulfovibrio sp. TomC]|uniref:ABC transporter ATP-binding protein n=1 Tax=Desulfovibrio sp. TomC TaxID=1562888 RepID=UPI0005740E2D|nr:ABC transporter ATP-binding protein [Desulfovibrio sp. TomC]KHK04542.1 Teichoic acid export ATP-binding protein TagH [Desulfovibrio sp. TomC]